MFKTPLQILKNNMIFIQPILFFILLLMLAMTYFVAGGVLSNAKLVLLVSVFLVAVSFSAGWFYINKLAVDDYNPNDVQEEITAKTIKNFRQFFSGVGEGFVRFLFAYIIYFALYFLVILALVKLGVKLYGEPKILMDFPKIVKTMTTQEELINYLNSVTMQDKVIFANWVLSITVLSSIANFFGFLYFTVITYTKKNIFYSLFNSICFAFKNIVGCTRIIVLMFCLYMFLNILSVILGNNALSFVLLIILFVLYLNYYVLLVFCFYNEKTEDNSNNRTELIG